MMSEEFKSSDVRNDDNVNLIAEGAALHQAGRLDEAARIYDEILARSPHDFDATHLLGVIALQRGEYRRAQRLINFAVAIRPHETAAISNLGVSYLRDGQLGPALQWFEIALKLQPDSPVALTNAAEVMHHMGRFADALPLLQRAHVMDPSSYSACNLLGACLMQIGDDHGAARVFETATRLRADEAEAWANLSVALAAIGQSDRASHCASQAASLQPNSPAAFNALAKAQLEQGRIADAVESYRRGLSGAPPSVEMLLSYAHALMANGLNDEALKQLDAALAIDPKNLTVRWAIALGQLKPIYESESEVLASRKAFDKSLDDIKSWYETTPGIEAPYRAVGTVQPFYLTYQHYNNRELLKKYGSLCALFMATLLRRTLAAERPPAGTGGPITGRKLRLGIVSAHVREHSVWIAVTKGWVQNLDRDKFEIHIFHLSTTVDRETEAAMALVDSFDNRTKDLAGWVEAIVAGELDVILYPEISTDPLTVKLASLRLAPVQAVTWGHPETSGLPTLDLYFSGHALEPPDAENNYSEKLVKLPSLSVYVEPLALPDADLDLASLRLPANQSLLLCAGQPFKYAPQFDDVWVRIAKGLQSRTLFGRRSAGRLVFFRSHDSTSDGMLEKRLRTAFARDGVDFDSHVSIVPFLDHAQFFALMRRAALMLDTLGFSGINTALQGVECGLPVLAFEGNFMRARLASAIMRELDLPELVATGADDFVQKAVALVRDPGGLGRVRKKIVERRGRLFRNLAPVRALERCLIEAAANRL